MTRGPDGKPGAFPTTIVSQVLAIKSADPAARARSLDVIAEAYYKPVYKYTRLRWKKSEDEARDITQDFFATAFESGTFARYDPQQARFRTFIRVCLDRFISKHHRARRALKRGGATTVLSFDFEGIERELARTPDAIVASAEDYFDTEWVRHLLGTAIDALRSKCELERKLPHFTVFERLDLCADPENRPSYADVARELGMAVTDVNNRLAWVRREFRRIVLDRLRELTATEDEFRSEAQAVLGIRV
jgi:RNA polymerase sigma factor (sigma-70 family)